MGYDRLRGDGPQGTRQAGRADLALRRQDARLDALEEVPPFGVILKDVALLATTDKAVEHGLGRVPVAAVVVKASVATGYIYKSFTSTHVTVQATLATTVDLWVF